MKTALELSKHTLLSIILLLTAAPLRAQNGIRYVARPGSEVQIEGTSSIHAWAVKGLVIAGFMDLSPAFDQDLKTLTLVPKVEVTIPVRSLKSGNGTMDEVMQEYMNIKGHPQIKYRLTGLTVKIAPKGANGPGEYVSTGELTVSGKTKIIEMPVTIERVDASKLKINAAMPLKMTDFGIKPPSPTITLNLIKTGDDVKISLEWVVAKAAEIPPMAK